MVRMAKVGNCPFWVDCIVPANPPAPSTPLEVFLTGVTAPVLPGLSIRRYPVSTLCVCFCHLGTAYCEENVLFRIMGGPCPPSGLLLEVPGRSFCTSITITLDSSCFSRFSVGVFKVPTLVADFLRSSLNGGGDISGRKITGNKGIASVDESADSSSGPCPDTFPASWSDSDPSICHKTCRETCPAPCPTPCPVTGPCPCPATCPCASVWITVLGIIWRCCVSEMPPAYPGR